MIRLFKERDESNNSQTNSTYPEKTGIALKASEKACNEEPIEIGFVFLYLQGAVGI